MLKIILFPLANQEFRKALVIFMIPRGDAVFDFFLAMFVFGRPGKLARLLGVCCHPSYSIFYLSRKRVIY